MGNAITWKLKKSIHKATLSPGLLTNVSSKQKSEVYNNTADTPVNFFSSPNKHVNSTSVSFGHVNE